MDFLNKILIRDYRTGGDSPEPYEPDSYEADSAKSSIVRIGDTCADTVEIGLREGSVDLKFSNAGGDTLAEGNVRLNRDFGVYTKVILRQSMMMGAGMDPMAIMHSMDTAERLGGIQMEDEERRALHEKVMARFIKKINGLDEGADIARLIGLVASFYGHPAIGRSYKPEPEPSTETAATAPAEPAKEATPAVENAGPITEIETRFSPPRAADAPPADAVTMVNVEELRFGGHTADLVVDGKPTDYQIVVTREHDDLDDEPFHEMWNRFDVCVSKAAREADPARKNEDLSWLIRRLETEIVWYEPGGIIKSYYEEFRERLVHEGKADRYLEHGEWEGEPQPLWAGERRVRDPAAYERSSYDNVSAAVITRRPDTQIDAEQERANMDAYLAELKRQREIQVA